MNIVCHFAAGNRSVILSGLVPVFTSSAWLLFPRSPAAAGESE
ncbi:MAG: hypothetical protein ABSG60_02440 [Terracidiphilus sp.]